MSFADIDPDLTADELQGAIERALEKRKELEAALPEGTAVPSGARRNTSGRRAVPAADRAGAGWRSASSAQGARYPPAAVQRENRVTARP